MDQIPNKIKSRLKKYHHGEIDLASIYKPDIKNENDLIIYLKPINNIRRVNKFHEQINSKLNYNGLYLCSANTLEQRRIIVREKIPTGFKTFFRIIDFFFKRVIPKLPILKNVYFSLTKGYNRAISKSEMLGRLISCGFEVMEYFEYNSRLYVISKKNKKPDFNMNPSYGPILKIDRVGYNGEIIKVYKMRTMYPYSEYCQELILKENNFDSGGKVFNDYRITTWGKFLRKYWVDELPNLINLFSGNMKLIGVRPVSLNYFNKLSKELQELRIQTKPACIGIHYVTVPRNFDEVINYEIKYLKKYLKKPYKTDFNYLFKFFYNVFFKAIRSR